MKIFKIRPLIEVEAETFPAARNKVLRVLAQAEQDGRISRFALSYEEGA